MTALHKYIKYRLLTGPNFLWVGSTINCSYITIVTWPHEYFTTFVIPLPNPFHPSLNKLLKVQSTEIGKFIESNSLVFGLFHVQKLPMGKVLSDKIYLFEE